MTLAVPGYLIDPVLRLMPSEPPETFMRMSLDEQKWRGRFFIMTWVITGDEPYSWALALADDPEHESQRLVESTDDAIIIDRLRTVEEDNTDVPPPATPTP